MSEAVDATRRMYDAINAQDAEGLLGMMDPAVRLWEPESLPHGGAYEGHEGIGAFLGKLADHYEPDIALEADEIIDAGDVAVALSRFRARVRATGAVIDVRLAEVIRVRDGRIVDLRVYPDTAVMVRALSGAATPA